MDRVASRKPRPELRVRTTKQMIGIFPMAHSLKKESPVGYASEREIPTLAYSSDSYSEDTHDLSMEPYHEA